MALASYCIASHCIPIISPINPSPLRRKRQFYFCCFIFPFSPFRAAAAAFESVCVAAAPCNINPAQNFQQQRNRSKERRRRGKGRKSKKKNRKTNIYSTTTNSPRGRPAHHLHTYMLYSNTDYSTLYSTVSTQCTHLSPHPHPHPHPQLFNASNYPLFQKSQFVDRQNFPRGSRCVHRFSLFFSFFFFETGVDQGCVGSGQVRSGQVRTVCMYVQCSRWVCKVGRWVGRLMYFAMPCRSGLPTREWEWRGGNDLATCMTTGT